MFRTLDVSGWAGRWSPVLREALLDAWAVLSPVTCAGCGADDRALCADCASALRPRPVTTNIAGVRVTSAFPFEGAAAAAIGAFKDRGRTDVAGPLARALAAALGEALGEAADGVRVEVVAMGTSRAAFRRRGYDPVGLLLRRCGVRRPAPVLRRVRRTETQKRLGRDDRRRNLALSLAARGRLDGRVFLVVDDVVTTGATIVEMVRAIRSAGGTVLAAATLASTPRRPGRGSDASSGKQMNPPRIASDAPGARDFGPGQD